jgi:hypothetical protein
MLHIELEYYLVGCISRYIPCIARRFGYIAYHDQYTRDIVMLSPATYSLSSCFIVVPIIPFRDADRSIKYCIPVYNAYLLILADGIHDWYSYIMLNATLINSYIGAYHRAQTEKWREIYAYKLSHYLCPMDSDYYAGYCDKPPVDL